MIDGSYAFQVDTPLGKKHGKVNLKAVGDVLHAETDAPIIGKQKTTGTMDGDTFAVEGQCKVRLLGKITYKMQGEVKGDEIFATIDYGKGKLDVRGKRA